MPKRTEVESLRKNLIRFTHDQYLRLCREMDALEGKDFVNAYLSLAEYCIPKLQRTEHTGSIETKEVVTFKVAGQEIPFEQVKNN